MDIRSLKLELLERIALIDNEARLLALKRVLDAPRGYDTPDGRLSVVKEPDGSQESSDAPTYSWTDVQRLLDEDRRLQLEGNIITDEELAELDRRHAARVNGTSKGLSMEDSLQLLGDRKK